MSNQDLVFMDGEYIEMDKATIPVRNHAFLYGTSVFEGIRAYYNTEEDQMYPINKIDNRTLGNGEVGPIFQKLQALYNNVVRGKITKYNKWCTPIYD